jgi:ApbE superfamily uncharacterized protein (UPF0280 family)
VIEGQCFGGAIAVLADDLVGISPERVNRAVRRDHLPASIGELDVLDREAREVATSSELIGHGIEMAYAFAVALVTHHAGAAMALYDFV